MKKRYRYLILLVAVAALPAGAFLALRDEKVAIETYTSAGRLPAIHPDYVGTVMPPNIAPLNFVVDEPGTRYYVRTHAAKGADIEVSTSEPRIEIPIEPWRAMVNANRNGDVYFDVYVENADGGWTRFDTISNTVAPEEIDGYLAYRQIRHVSRRFRYMGIYQRNLENYDESPILRNQALGGRKDFGHGCVNCHTFLNNRPDSMILHVRLASGPNPAPTLLFRDGRIANVDTRTGPKTRAAGIITWHPSGRLAAFSTNRFEVFCHSSGFNVEGLDFDSDMAIYLIDSNTITTTPVISRHDRHETFPTWSPDGEYLYFCSAPKLPLERFKEVRYDLMRIRYDQESNTWGELETLLSARETGMSITEPRVSPDGRLLLFCMARYGVMPTYQPEADLYLMDLETGRHRRLDCNSDRPESWHSWSSNSRWIAFSSKRGDGLYARPYLSYVDKQGKAHKPILLPQKDPTFYDSFLQHFNLPELITGPVPLTRRELVNAIVSPDEVVKVKVAHGVGGPGKPADASGYKN